MPRPRRRRVIGRDEFGARLDVDELRSGSLRVGQEPLAAPLPTRWKCAAFPRRTAGHEHGPAPPLDRADRVGTVDSVEPHLDHVGKRRRVARAAELLHGSSGDGGAQKWVYACS